MTAITNEMIPATIQSAIFSGSRLEYRDDDSAILKSGKRVDHGLYLILSLFVPFWFVLWLIFGFVAAVLAPRRAVRDHQVDVDAGQVQVVACSPAPSSGTSRHSKAAGTYCPRCRVYTSGTPPETDCDVCYDVLLCAELAPPSGPA